MSKNGKRGGQWQAAGALSGAGFLLVGCVVAGYALGDYLDRRLHTEFLMPVCVLLGAAAGFAQIFRMLARLSKK